MKIAIAAVLVLLFVCCGAAAGADPVSDEKSLSSAVAKGDFDVYLKDDITLGSTLSISGHGTLNLNGHKLIWAGSMGSIIRVESSGELTLSSHDSKDEKSITGGVITGGNAERGGGVYVASGGRFTMISGSITGNTAMDDGGGVYVEHDGTFKVKGTPVINGNTKNGVPNNVYLFDQTYIFVTGELMSGAYIGIINPLRGKFGQSDEGYTITEADAACFHPDGSSTLTATIVRDGLFWDSTPTPVYVAKIDESHKYSTVQEAVKAAESGLGTTITMIADSTEATIKIGKEVTLDLAGHVLSNTGSGSVITINSGGNLTLKDGNPTTEHKFSVEDGGLWKLNNSGDESIYGGVITNGSAGYGGGVFITSGGTFTMMGGNIIGNSASTGGGGVRVYGGTFTLLSDGTITGNSAAWGGGVFIDNSGRFEMKSGSISGNCAPTGTYGSGGGGVNMDNGIFNMYDGSITGNIQKSNDGTYSGGGGVRVSGGTFNMSGGSIENNNAMWDGGGVATRPSGKFTMSGSASIKNNNAKHDGGGVFVGGPFEMKDMSSITGNTADNNGGGVCLHKVETNWKAAFNVSGTPVISGNKKGTDTNNVYLPDQKTINVTGELKSGAYIGIINPLEDGAEFAQGSASHTVDADDAQYFYADNETARLKAVVADSTKTFAESKLKWEGKMVAQIDESHKYSTVQEAVNAAGIDSLSNTITMIDNSTEATITVDKNVTLDLAGHVLSNTGSGLVISIISDGNLTVTDTGSTAHYFKFVANGPWTPYSGTPSSSVDLANFNFTEAKAAEGEGYYVKVTGGVITGGKKSNGGGVLVQKSGTFTMNGGTIVGNTAVQYGGGVYVASGGTFTMNGGTIDGNKAYGGGGVFVHNSGTFTMNGGTIVGNTANSYGGGVYVYESGMFTMNGGTIVGNTANSYGGGVYVYKSDMFTMISGSITGNTAMDDGGGVYVDDGTFNVSGAPEIRGNTVGGSANNVFLVGSESDPEKQTYITLTGTLESGAEIHITSPVGDNKQFGVVDESYTGVTQADADCFIADNPNVKAVLNPTASPKQLTWAVGYTVAFEMNGHGTPIDNTTVFSGNTVAEPAAPKAEGYTFGGWFTDIKCTDGNKYDFSTQVTQDITLYAKWTAVIQSYTIKFNGNGGTVTPETLTVKYGESVNLSEKVTATRDGYTHSGWALSSTGTAIYAAAQNVTDLGDTTLYAVWEKTEELSGINVTVKQGSTPQDSATVELKQGSVVIKNATTDENGKASIIGVPKGTYTLVVTKGEKTKTRAVTVPCDDVTINLPTKDIKAEVEVKSDKGTTPAVAVNGTDDIVKDDEVGEGNKVTVTVVVETKKDGSAPDVQDEIDKIKTLVTDANSKLEYLGIIIEKKVNEISVDPINETVNVLTFIIPYDFTKKHNIKLYRCHEGTSELLNVIQLKPETPTQEGYYLDSSNNQIYLYAKKFSTYSVGYSLESDPQPTPSSGGSSRSSGSSARLPAAPADTQGAQTTRDITAQYAGHTFVGVTAGVLSNPGDVNPEITAAAEIKISTAKAAGIKVTNSKGAPALILTNNAAEGLDTVTFCEVYDIKPTNPNEKLTQVTITVPKADVIASGLTTDDVTIYHFLEAYDIWVPLDTLQITEDEANYYYTAATDGASPFGVLIKKFDAEPVKPGQPVNPQPTSASPLPLAGVIAGLGAAGILFGLRRK